MCVRREGRERERELMSLATYLDSCIKYVGIFVSFFFSDIIIDSVTVIKWKLLQFVSQCQNSSSIDQASHLLAWTMSQLESTNVLDTRLVLKPSIHHTEASA